jgi:short-subunit dehydrogenase
MNTSPARPLAVVTGASSGIGFELARECAQHGFDLIIAADRPLTRATRDLEGYQVAVEGVETDLAAPWGVEQVCQEIHGRPVAALIANAGHGLGKAFMDQEIEDIEHVIATNITGTIRLVRRVGADMLRAGGGKILIVGSISGLMPGAFQAVYNGTKAFIDSFSAALRNELKDTSITVTCLMPGVTDTEFYRRADMMDTKIGRQDDKADPVDVARVGFTAMMDGQGDVVVGLKNKLQAAAAHVTPSPVLAEQHRKVAEPGSARKH